MANATRKHFGTAHRGKGAGVGALADIPAEGIGENMVLSNRDKAQHSRARGLDGRAIETEQLRDHVGNRPN